MKKLFVSFFCLMIVLILSSCDEPDTDKNDKGMTESNTEEISIAESESESESEAEEEDNFFISQEVRNTWESDLTSILSGVDIWDIPNGMPGSHAIGLMDLNFDNVPEVLVAYPGGSMGNVHIEIYDLKTHNRIAYYFGMSYENNEGGIRLYVAKTNGGYVTLAEGGLRDPESGWCNIIHQLSSQLEIKDYDLRTESLFTKAQAANTLGQGPYFFRGEHVEKEKYDEEYEKFLNNYKEVEATEIQLIRWDKLEVTNSEQRVPKMVNALINSSQEFIYFKD